MKKILVVVDMQNDFIDGALGTKEAQAILENVIRKIESCKDDILFATRDTHPENYLDTQEGKNLPVKHCIKGTEGWQIRPEIQELLDKYQGRIIDKPSFGSIKLADQVSSLVRKLEEKGESAEIELVGLCTDICVISNALLLKARMPEVPIFVDPTCCAGVTPALHEAALQTMSSCQIHQIPNELRQEAE